MDALNPKHVEFVREKVGYKFCTGDCPNKFGKLVRHYHHPSRDILHLPERTPMITYEFMHELIKGLDGDDRLIYYRNMINMMTSYDEDDPLDALVTIAIQCATVDQLLQAYWMVFNG